MSVIFPERIVEQVSGCFRGFPLAALGYMELLGVVPFPLDYILHEYMFCSGHTSGNRKKSFVIVVYRWENRGEPFYVLFGAFFVTSLLADGLIRPLWRQKQQSERTKPSDNLRGRVFKLLMRIMSASLMRPHFTRSHLR